MSTAKRFLEEETPLPKKVSSDPCLVDETKSDTEPKSAGEAECSSPKETKEEEFSQKTKVSNEESKDKESKDQLKDNGFNSNASPAPMQTKATVFGSSFKMPTFGSLPTVSPFISRNQSTSWFKTNQGKTRKSRSKKTTGRQKQKTKRLSGQERKTKGLWFPFEESFLSS